MTCGRFNVGLEKPAWLALHRQHGELTTVPIPVRHPDPSIKYVKLVCTCGKSYVTLDDPKEEL